MAKYIYGIINSKKIAAGEEIHAIPYQDISAVVSDSEIIDYRYLSKEALARQLIKHQQVIEEIMRGTTIIPMRLGTFAVDEAEVKDILEKGYSLIKEIFPKVKDKIEIDVCVTWCDFGTSIKEAGEEREVKEAKEKLLANPKGITVEDQIKVGTLIKKALDKKREEYAQEIQGSLKDISQEFKRHELMDDKMIINIAFLIERSRQEDFDKRVEGLDVKFARKLNFRCVGPLPPYSFYTLEVRKMEFEEIDWARKRLGLSDLASKDEIRKAYHRSAASAHPDVNLDAPGIEEEFDEANMAYLILLEYCQNDSCSFTEEDFQKNAILVKVRE